MHSYVATYQKGQRGDQRHAAQAHALSLYGRSLLDGQSLGERALGDVIVLGSGVLPANGLILCTRDMVSVAKELLGAGTQVIHLSAAIVLELVGPRGLAQKDVREIHRSASHSRGEEGQHIVVHHSVLEEVVSGTTCDGVGVRDLKKALEERIDSGNSEAEREGGADSPLHREDLIAVVRVRCNLDALTDIRGPHLLVLRRDEQGGDADELELGTRRRRHHQVAVHHINCQVKGLMAEAELNGNVNEPVDDDSAHLLGNLGLLRGEVSVAAGVVTLLLEVHVANLRNHVGAVSRQAAVTAIGVGRDVARLGDICGGSERSALRGDAAVGELGVVEGKRADSVAGNLAKVGEARGGHIVV